ncbi:MAG: tyrosine--tRNA ligase [Candidatus Omnitrophica bacterium]|nr:tyrosine--tRNA ligase [Candidatus Omnitrophota bacterium]
MNSIDLLCQNAAEVIDREELKSRLEESQKSGKPLRVKAGFDPSAPDIHLGHTVLLRKLRQFQDAGHKVVFIIGDYTAMIGDPTGQTKTRPALSRDEVEKNAETYKQQAFRILDGDPKKIEVVRNGEWLGAADMFQIFFEKISPLATVDQLLAREDFDKRRKAHRPISFREFLYPLLQGYDSVRVRADLELGGTDQKFNLLMGRDLQSGFGQRPQIVMTMPLLTGLDGTQKMSKSLGNAIGVLDGAPDMFGKIMSIPDALMEPYFKLLTLPTDAEWKEISAKIKTDPRNAKRDLAMRVVNQYHGESAAQKAAQDFDRVFRDKKNPEAPKELFIEGRETGIADLLKMSRVVGSTSAAYRLVEQGGVSIDGKKILDPKTVIKVKDGQILKAGKKAFFRIIPKKK